MGMSNMDPTDLRVQLEVCRERLKYSEEKVRQQEKILIRVYKDLDQKEAELKQIRIEREDLRIKWEVLQRDFKYSEHSLAEATQENTKKKKKAQIQGLFASLIFLFSSVLVLCQDCIFGYIRSNLTRASVTPKCQLTVAF